MQESGHYHLHINHFPKDSDESLPVSVRVLSERYGFLSTLCKIRGEDGALSPLWIVTKKVPARAIAEKLFDLVLENISSDPGMNGYVELENVPRGNVARYQEKPYAYGGGFPLGPLRSWLQKRKRGADIHIFRNREVPYDHMDTMLQNAGFYEVITPTQRIWTLLLENAEDANIEFHNYKHYLERAGGVSRIEMEIVEKISPIPREFSLLPVVPKQLPQFPSA